MADPMLEVDDYEIFVGQLLGISGSYGVYSGTIFEASVDGDGMAFGYVEGIYTGNNTANAGTIVEMPVDGEGVIPLGFTEYPYEGFHQAGSGSLSEIKQGSSSPHPGDNMRLYDYMDNTKTHTVKVVNGVIASWDISTEGGMIPNPPNTHSIVIEDGVIKSWSVVPGGSRPNNPSTHTVDIVKGLVQSWTEG